MSTATHGREAVTNSGDTMRAMLLATTSIVAALAMSAPANAQNGQAEAQAAQADANPPAPDDASKIVITGIRKSLQDSLAAKRQAINVVDSISAEEVGKFPDNNLAESLQRVPGVAVARNFGLGQQISVRGLGPDFQNVLLNGRSLPSDTGAWTADGGGAGRSFNFDVLPAEMISRVDINKTMTPGLTEGGIGSTINIITPRPLDLGKTYVTFSAAANSVEKHSKITPTLTGLVSWVNPSDTFGISLSGSYTNILASRDYYRVDQWDNTDQTNANSVMNLLSGDPANPTVKEGTPIVPRQMSWGKLSGGTKRAFGGATIQFKPTDTITMTLDGFYSHLNQTIPDSIVHAWFGNTVQDPTIASDGVLTGGTYPGEIYLNQPQVQANITAAGGNIQIPRVVTIERERDRVAKTFEAGWNGKWEATPNVEVVGDVSYAKSTGDKPFDPYFWIGENAQNGVSWSLPGPDPVVSINDPVFTDPTLNRVGYTGDWRQTIDDHIFEASLNGTWRSQGGILKSVQAGLDYQDHSKHLENYYMFDSPYPTIPIFPVPTNLLTQASLGSNFMNGQGTAPVINYLGYDPRAMFAFLSDPATLAQIQNYDPSYICPGGSNCAKVTADINHPGGPYAQVDDIGGSFTSRERVLAGYVDSRWAGSHWAGDIGVRVVHVNNVSEGYGQTLSSFPTPVNGQYIFTSANFTAPSPISHSNGYWSILPSANLKIGLAENLLLRLGASRSLTRCDLNACRYGGSGPGSWSGTVGHLSTSEWAPDLKPQYSKNLDASLEWYINSASYMSAAGFYKDITNLFGSATTLEDYPGAPEQVYVSRNINIGTGKVRGVELAAQYTLGKWAGIFSGFGAAGNYTHVKTSTSAGCGIAGVSPDSYNASAFYDNGRLEVRGAYNWRSKWVMACSWAGPGLDEMHKSYGQVDASIRFKLNQRIELFADAVNLTNAGNYLYWGDNRPIQSSLDYRHFDLGVRFAWSPAAPPPPPPPAMLPPPQPAAPPTQTCADGSVILATQTCAAPPPPPPPPPAPAPERGL